MNQTASFDFEQARFNMIEQQIRPWEVLDQDILDTLMVVRREEFVPGKYQAIALSDTEVPLIVDGVPTGETMFTPKVEARLLQALDAQRHESVIEVGAGSGYMAALLARRADRVLSLERHPGLVAFAQANIARAGLLNCEVIARDGASLLTDESVQADVILLSGSVSFIPDALIARLKPGGRLAAISGDSPVMSACLVRVGPRREISRETLFETYAKPLVGFPRRDAFRF
ncbi:MAG: protein-L-isoaspartate O-methyltransferase [Burkholderiaceae bacterium]